MRAYTLKPEPLTKAAQERADKAAYWAVTLRDNDTCQRCLRDCGPIARDHRVNRSQGGTTTVANMHLLGLTCHIWATEHPVQAILDGWAAPGFADPTEWPARRWLPTRSGTVRLCWVLMDDDSTWLVIPDSEAQRAMKDGA